MIRALRWIMLVVAAGQALLAVAMIWRPPILLEVWPFPDTTELTFIFLALDLRRRGGVHGLVVPVG